MSVPLMGTIQQRGWVDGEWHPFMTTGTPSLARRLPQNDHGPDFLQELSEVTEHLFSYPEAEPHQVLSRPVTI